MMSLTGNRLGLLLGFICVATVFTFADTSLAIWDLWVSDDNPTYSHGPLLLLVSLWIVVREWRLRAEVIQLNLSLLPVLLLLGCGVVWFFAKLGTVQIIQMLAVVFVFALLFWSLLGFRHSLIFLFPVLLMLCALPIWDGLGYYLQMISAVTVGELASWTISPSVREGMFILIPAGTFEVASGCSGLSYFIVSIIISLLYVYFNRVPLRHAGYYVAAAMGIAVVANIIRVYTIVLSGQLTNMQSYFITGEHVSLGWVVFGIGITVYLLFVQRFLPEEVIAKNNDGVNVRAERKNGQVSIVNVLLSNQLFGLAAIVCCVLVGPVAATIYQKDLFQTRSFEANLPAQISGWQKQEYLGSYHPRAKPGNLMVEASYRQPDLGQDVYLYLNYFYSQRQGAEAVNDLTRVADGRFWQKLSASVYDPGLEGFDDVQEFQLSARNGEKKLLWWWYETNGVRTSLSWKAKLHNIFGIVRGEPAIAIMAVAVPLLAEPSQARIVLHNFIESSRLKIRVIPTVISD